MGNPVGEKGGLGASARREGKGANQDTARTIGNTLPSVAPHATQFRGEACGARAVE